MTQGVYQFPSFEPRFDTTEKLPPCNIEAEEAVLGAIMFDPQAIYRVKDRLQPEHFYITAHKDIYQACLRLCKKDRPNDMASVVNWLSDHDILTRIGGRNKLATLVDRTVSAVNIDHLASIIIEKAVRRELIKALNEGIHLAYTTDVELPDVLSTAHEKVRSIVEIPAPTKDDYQEWKHDRLLSELTKIYTTCTKPSLKLLKLKDLANEHHLSMNFLETFYLKSLVAQCTKLLTYEELKELAGSTVREWLLNGLVPKDTTILLAADGGIGKTKLVYSLGKILIQGEKFGHFHSTGDKRRILYYQGDESPGDMMQALESLGYGVEDINKHVRTRFGWSAENMPALIQDLTEFKPDFVVIDSLSTANKFSNFQESQMEYARPILEMTGLAVQHNTTFLIIHHTNREGGVRGTTAIRNAVSEVWTLTKDNSETATPHDRLLLIDKSRSRSSGKKYRLIFSPDDLSFTFLGEECERGHNPAEQSAKNTLLEFFSTNRNIKFCTEELAERTQYSKGHLRNCLSSLVADGLISCQRRPGQANFYYLVMEGGDREVNDDHPPNAPNFLRMTTEAIAAEESQPMSEDGINSQDDHPRSAPDQPPITPHDHSQKVTTTGNTAEGDRAKYSFDDEKKSENLEGDKNGRSLDHLCPEVSPSNNSEVIVGCDRDLIVDSTPDHPPTTFNGGVDEDVFYPGQEVEVVVDGDFKGQVLKVSSVTGNLCWLVRNGRKRGQSIQPIGPFAKHQIRKAQQVKEVTIAEPPAYHQLDMSMRGVDLTKTPEFIEGHYYWSERFQQRVKLVRLIEDTADDFKNPEALIIPDNAPPTNVSLEDLRCCLDSPVCVLKPNDVVVCHIGYKQNKPVGSTGAVARLDSLWVWVRVLVNGRISDPKKFYAHRVVRADG